MSIRILCIKILYAEKWELDKFSVDYWISIVDMQLCWDDASILIRIRVLQKLVISRCRHLLVFHYVGYMQTSKVLASLIIFKLDNYISSV